VTGQVNLTALALVAELTRHRIEAWQKQLTEAPKLKRTGKAGVKSHKKPSKGDPPEGAVLGRELVLWARSANHRCGLREW